MKIYDRRFGQQGITIVPMLDILTILLIFFIVHTEFKRQVSVLKLDVPQTQHLAGTQGIRTASCWKWVRTAAWASTAG